MTITEAPGVHITEALRPSLARRVNVAQPIPVMIGEATSGPVANPTVVNSWREFSDVFGGFGYDASRKPMWLGWGVSLHFQAGGSSVYIIRVLGQGHTHAEVTVDDKTTEPVPEGLEQGFQSPAFLQPAFDAHLQAASNPGSFDIRALSGGSSGDELQVVITDNVLGGGRFNVDVTRNGVLLERWISMIMNPNDARYFPATVNSDLVGSHFITVVDNTTANFTGPADGTYTLDGGSDGQTISSTDYVNAVSLIGAVEGSVLVGCPGNVESVVQSALVNHCEQRTNGFAILDGPDAPITAALSHVATLPVSSYGALYYPWPVVTDPGANRAGATRAVPPSGAIVGMFQRNDLGAGPHYPAAGITAAVPGALGLSQVITLSQYGTLNTQHVNGLRTLPGSNGVNLYGVRTLRKGTIDQYIGVRRSLIYIKQSLLDLLQFAVFRNNDNRLWAQVTGTCTDFLMNFWQAGGLRGGTVNDAFFVTCNSENNTITSIESGELHVDVGVALQTPAEFVIITIGLWEGGATTEERTF